MQKIEHNGLPAAAIAGKLNDTLLRHTAAVLTAPPGAGKSTLLPLTILRGLLTTSQGEATSQTAAPSQGEALSGKILMLEPRRLAARQIAERMAEMIGEPVGKTVGYRVRHDTKVSKDTRIEVLTEGILTRMIVADPTLEGVSVVIFDEFHERSLVSDLALALTRETQSIIRPDLRILIMSATIDTATICQSLGAPLIESEGRMHPVDIRYTNEDSTARVVLQAYREHEGDILVFLPGEAEIKRLAEQLQGGTTARQDQMDTNPSDSALRVYPLYGMLSPEEQRRAIAPSREGERKIVLATSIAETSITIEGVRVVVDTGLCRKMVFDQRTGLSHLDTVRISMDMANQRSGRAGRVAPGVCYRMWAKTEEYAMDECRTPEIMEADLAPMLLDVAAWGEGTVDSLTWMTPPPPAHIRQGESLLRLLNATDDKGLITKHGRELWRQPYHPRIAQMITCGGNSTLALKIADILDKQPTSWPKAFGEPGAGALLALAYPERVAKLQAEGIGRYMLASGDMATVNADEELFGHEWIAIASMNATGGGHVFLGAPVHPADLHDLITERNNLSWDNKQGCIVAQHERRIGKLLLDSRPVHNLNRQQVIDTVCAAAKKHGLGMLDFGDKVQNLQRRIAAVSEWRPELELPDVSTEAVLAKADEWLPTWLEGVTAFKVSELKKIDLYNALWNLLTWEQQQAVDRLAPTHITVPTGSKIRMEYRQGAELPIVRVRLQECFGLTDTPRVDDGRRPALMELLSPGFKPVQLTSDLRSFWQETYFEVRKELRRRYPKHSWPDNPLEAMATRGVARKSS